MEKRQFKILIVDDNPTNIQFVELALQQKGYQTGAAYNGQEALQFLNEESYDLILLDVMMPYLNGFELCEILQKDEQKKNIPVIFLTARTDKESLVRAFEVGGVDYISKPFKINELLLRVKTHLALSTKQELEEELIERRKVEKALIESQKRLELVLASVPNTIFEVDLQGNLISTNRPHPLSNVNIDIGSPIFNSSAEQLDNKLVSVFDNCIKNREVISYEIKINFETETFWLKKTLVPVITGDELISVLLIIADITSRKRIELQLKTYQNELESALVELSMLNSELENKSIELQELNTTKDKLFSIIAHDLKNPFNMLIGYSDILQRNLHKYSTEKIAYYIDIINNSARTGFNLLENLLEWSRAQTGRLVFIPTAADIMPVITENIDLLEGEAKRKGIVIKCYINESVKVFIDQNMISTVVRNILSNAVKFTAKGKISISGVQVENFYEITVEDTGRGISEENINKLFRNDIHFSEPGTSDEKGTGLGLILCKEFIERNGGSIFVKSEIGKGTSFIFTIPLFSKCEIE